MAQSKIAAKQPAVLDVEAGQRVVWCACGMSNTQPYCDGSHSGSGIKPVSVKIEQTQKVALCQCKQTGNPPYCDGTHASI